MNDRKPKIHSRADEGEEANFDLQSLEDQTAEDEEKVPFSTRLTPSIYEKLRAIAFHEDTTISGLTEAALRDMIEAMEEDRGEPYQVYEPHKIDR